MLDFLKRLFHRRTAEPPRDAKAGRQEAVEGLRQGEEHFAQLVGGVRDYAVFLLDPDGRVLTWNTGAERIKGWQAHEIIGQHFSRFYPREAAASGWPDHELRVAEETGRYEEEDWRVRKDGSRFWASVVISTLRDEAGRVRGFLKITRDLTDRKQAEEKLRLSEERFRLLVEGVKDYAIFMLDPEGRIATWNAGAERIKGYTSEEIIGQHFSIFYPKEDVEAGKPPRELEIARATGKYEEESWRLRKDGGRFWASVVITALRDEGGVLRGFGKVTRDMTDRKKAEEDARRLLQEEAARKAAEEHADEMRRAKEDEARQREQLHVTLASIGDAVIVTDREGRVTFLNPAAAGLTGWEPEEAEGQPLERVFPIINERTRQPAENPVNRVIREETVVGLANHTALLRRGGAEAPIEDSAAPIRGPGGAVRGAVLVFRDVSRRRRAEQAVLEEKRVAEALLRFSGLLSAERDLHRLVQLATDESTRLTNAKYGAFFYNVIDAHGESYVLYSLSGAPPEAFATFPMPRNTDVFDATFRGTGVLRLADVTQDPRYGKNPPYNGQPPGHLPVHSYLAVPVVSRSGEVLGGLFFGHDEVGVFGEREERLAVAVASQAAVAVDNARLVEQLRRRADQLAEADRRKDEFLALLGHELRNPLAPIRNAAGLLGLAPGDLATVEHARELIERQVTHLARLVDELLDAARIASGKVQLRKERLDLAALVRSAAEDQRHEVEDAGLTLEVEAPAAPVWVDGDAVRLTQVVANLLHNAVKFTDPGGRVMVRLTADAAAGRAEVSVRDTGVGMEPAMVGRLFEAFAQADRSLDRSKGGLGLGLSVVRGLVRLHGGDVRASSAGLGQGSEFVFWVPPAEPPGSPPPPAEAAPARAGAKTRILIIEDNRDAADSMRLLLRLTGGHAVDVAYSGAEGIERARASPPDVVLCDLGLPGLSGFDVARALRADAATAGALLVAVSGYGRDEDRRRAVEAGFDDLLVKPVEPAVLQRLLAGRAGAETA